jgi:hypothetical protein
MEMSELFDVIAVNLHDYSERVIATQKTEENAMAIVEIAVARRGVTDEIFKVEPHTPRPLHAPPHEGEK